MAAYPQLSHNLPVQSIWLCVPVQSRNKWYFVISFGEINKTKQKRIQLVGLCSENILL